MRRYSRSGDGWVKSTEARTGLVCVLFIALSAACEPHSLRISTIGDVLLLIDSSREITVLQTDEAETRWRALVARGEYEGSTEHEFSAQGVLTLNPGTRFVQFEAHDLQGANGPIEDIRSELLGLSVATGTVWSQTCAQYLFSVCSSPCPIPEYWYSGPQARGIALQGRCSGAAKTPACAQLCTRAQCDPATAASPGGCCGDGKLDHFEECDDGNTRDGDACSGGCTRPVGTPIFDVTVESRPFTPTPGLVDGPPNGRIAEFKFLGQVATSWSSDGFGRIRFYSGTADLGYVAVWHGQGDTVEQASVPRSITGTSPNAVVVISLSNLKVEGGHVNAEIHLHETTGVVEVHYGSVSRPFSGAAFEVGWSRGLNSVSGGPLGCSPGCTAQEWPANTRITYTPSTLR